MHSNANKQHYTVPWCLAPKLRSKASSYTLLKIPSLSSSRIVTITTSIDCQTCNQKENKQTVNRLGLIPPVDYDIPGVFKGINKKPRTLKLEISHHFSLEKVTY